MIQDFGKMWRLIKDDPEYAWSWQCNIAVPIMDAGVEHRHANEYAARVMRSMFGVDITENPSWKATFPDDHYRLFKLYTKDGWKFSESWTVTLEAARAELEVCKEELIKNPELGRLEVMDRAGNVLERASHG